MIVLRSFDKILRSIFPAFAISSKVLGVLFSLHEAYKDAEINEAIVLPLVSFAFTAFR